MLRLVNYRENLTWSVLPESQSTAQLCDYHCLSLTEVSLLSMTMWAPSEKHYLVVDRYQPAQLPTVHPT